MRAGVLALGVVPEAMHPKDDHVGAIGRKRLRRRQPDAAIAADDDGDLIDKSNNCLHIQLSRQLGLQAGLTAPNCIMSSSMLTSAQCSAILLSRIR